jgi:fused signal recognition particle receptor
MPFWRRGREVPPVAEEPVESPVQAEPVESPVQAEPTESRVQAEPVEPPPDRPPAASSDESLEIDASDVDAAGSLEPVPPPPMEAEPAPAELPPGDPPASGNPAPAYAPFDPTAFLAVAPAHTLDDGLEKTRGSLVTQLRGYLGNADGPQWDEVEETLIAGDVGAALAIDIVERARKRRDPGGPEAAIRAELAALLVDREVHWQPRSAVAGGPSVVLVVGVNGTGKTTTIGKLAARYAGEGRTVILAAADTFRAAAIDQLRIWADRAEVPMVAHAPGADPGAVVYDAIDAAAARGADLVIADTAGRLHTRSNLMDELTKVRRIVDKRLPGAEPETLFVLDATTGQNGLAQARAFHEAVGLTGIVLTKLDSTAKGGIVFAIEDVLKVPVRFVGVGEGVDDLLPFDPEAFVEALFA